MTEKMTHQRDARKHPSLALYFPLLLGRRVKAHYCNIASSSGWQQDQCTSRLSITISLSTETQTSLLRAGGDAQIALAATARQEN